MLTRVSLFIKRHQKIIKVGNWRYYLKEKELSSVKVALSGAVIRTFTVCPDG